ncbi:hypothetical protein KZP23_04370 [Echinicola marina]|uniref:hypothetical protein n=1 Tax=Echinicola marina TaxID=2859768 RepID=UPI001CF671C9|nr:hypothetical protein [Echinicola marina]UCS94273.1 hypothetical protein KZP23_04370 [Echinicola marina]
MKKISPIAIIFIMIFVMVSCETKTNKKVEEAPLEQEEPIEEESTVKFQYLMQDKAYPDAMLELYSPLENEVFKEGGVPFEFNIKNYPFEEGRNGFQLNMIINGNDPVGYNMPIFKKDLNRGTYKVLAYLVDDEGLALKEYGNYVDRDFVVGESSPFPENEDPVIGLNLPHNGQVFEKDSPVLVDFILVGGDLKEDGMRIKISIFDKEYMVNDLGQVKINGLPVGKHKLELVLIDANDKEIPGIFSKSTKEIIVKN